MIRSRIKPEKKVASSHIVVEEVGSVIGEAVIEVDVVVVEDEEEEEEETHSVTMEEEVDSET